VKYLCHTQQRSLTRRKIFRHEADAPPPPPRQGSHATDFYRPLKIYHPRPGLKLRTLGTLASTTATGPPRTSPPPLLRMNPVIEISDAL
jgi:hypothetical protein